MHCCALTFDVRGGLRLAAGRPLDGGVSHRVLSEANGGWILQFPGRLCEPSGQTGEARRCFALELMASLMLPADLTNNLLTDRPMLPPLAQPEKAQTCLTGGTPRVRALADASGPTAFERLASAIRARRSTKRQGCGVGQTCSGLPRTPGAGWTEAPVVSSRDIASSRLCLLRSPPTTTLHLHCHHRRTRNAAS